MTKISLHILRTGLAITFLWIGVLILQNPEAWGRGFIQPWAVALLPLPLKTLMLGTAVLDILIGFFLLINRFVWQASLLGSLHLIVVLIVSGINAITIRDVGILAGVLTILSSLFPFTKIKGRFNNF